MNLNNQSSRKMAQTTRMHARMCLLQKQMLLFIPAEHTRAHDLSGVCVVCGAATTLRSCRAGANGVCIITRRLATRLQ